MFQAYIAPLRSGEALMQGFVLEGYNYQSILNKVEDLTELWYEHGLLCFREAHLSPTELAHVILEIGKVKNHFVTHGYSPGNSDFWSQEEGCPANPPPPIWTGWATEYGQVHIEPHTESIEQHLSQDPDVLGHVPQIFYTEDLPDAAWVQRLKDGLDGATLKCPVLSWHMENPHWFYPQLCSAFTMPWKSCPKDEGETGFLNYVHLYDSLPGHLQDIARTEPAFLLFPPSGRLAGHLVASEEQCAEVRALPPHLRLAQPDEHPPPGAIVVRPIALPHPITGEYSIRHCPGQPTGFINPDIAKSDFIELKQAIVDFTIDEDNQFWWQWTVGDFLLVDFSVMAHCVSPYPVGTRSMMGCHGYTSGKTDPAYHGSTHATNYV